MMHDFIPDPSQVRQIQENYLNRQRPVVLIGPMAAGKSYIGWHLARFYGYRFIDADQYFTRRYGPIPDFFEKYGQADFRAAEAKVVAEVLESSSCRNSIFSLGGGAPMTDSVAELLQEETVIYIKVDLETVRPRIEASTTRPLLQPDPVQRWQEITRARTGRYEQLASYTLDAGSHRTISAMTAEIQRFIIQTRKGAG
ncbi:MAG: shikimate kinase [Rothia sp. (in: high G+C Gram-positive bacteria)]|nr:shikimate kinase [Rothia sp. (in: high G+C Gram-positive bacteria)]